MPAADPGASRAAPDTADAAASACTGDAKATQLGLGVCTKLAYHSQAVAMGFSVVGSIYYMNPLESG